MYGEQLIEIWKEKAAKYPDELAAAMVKEYLDFGQAWYYESLGEREDFLMLYEVCSNVSKSVLRVLLGLNRLYLAHPRMKWVNETIDKMKIRPEKLKTRLKTVFQAGPKTGMIELQLICEDVYHLVEKYMPDVEIQRPQKPETWNENANPGKRRTL